MTLLYIRFSDSSVRFEAFLCYVLLRLSLDSQSEDRGRQRQAKGSEQRSDVCEKAGKNLELCEILDTRKRTWRPRLELQPAGCRARPAPGRVLRRGLQTEYRSQAAPPGRRGRW